MNSLIGLLIFISFLFIAFIVGYAVCYVSTLITKYKQLKKDIKQAQEDLFVIRELRRRLKEKTEWNSKNIQ